MSEVIVKDGRKITRVTDGKICSEITFYNNGNITLSVRKIENGD